MAGGLMQLVAYGAQDIYLTGNPQITFFKIVYRRYTNFAIETIEHALIGTVGFGNRLSAKITRNGDLISRMYIRVILSSVDPVNSNFAWIRRIGHAMINEVTVEIGGTVIDRQTGTWLDVWYELARQGDHDRGYAIMIGDVPELTGYNNNIKSPYIVYIPLQFWFNKFIGTAIPLIALQYHDTIINVNFEPLTSLIVSDCAFDINIPSMQDATILVNYIYLDTDERRRFALVGHEYLIEQVQFNGVETATTTPRKYILDFNHPTKELIWAVRNGNFSSRQAFLYYTNSDVWSLTEAGCVIINKSVSVGTDPRPGNTGTWVEVIAGQIVTVGTLNIRNKFTESVFVNPDSVKLLIDGVEYGITNKINADVTIEIDGSISCNNVVTALTVRDLSIPVSSMIDTRFNVCDPLVNIFSNYGILIDGTANPVDFALLQFNGHDRFDRREGMYFNKVQPDQCHTNTPKDGINAYSFALFPEQHQPSGTANLSRIESSVLTIDFRDITFADGLPVLDIFNIDSQMYIFALNYNILRIYSGFGGIAYSA